MVMKYRCDSSFTFIPYSQWFTQYINFFFSFLRVMSPFYSWSHAGLHTSPSSSFLSSTCFHGRHPFWLPSHQHTVLSLCLLSVPSLIWLGLSPSLSKMCHLLQPGHSPHWHPTHRYLTSLPHTWYPFSLGFSSKSYSPSRFIPGFICMQFLWWLQHLQILLPPA